MIGQVGCLCAHCGGYWSSQTQLWAHRPFQLEAWFDFLGFVLTWVRPVTVRTENLQWVVRLFKWTYWSHSYCSNIFVTPTSNEQIYLSDSLFKWTCLYRTLTLSEVKLKPHVFEHQTPTVLVKWTWSNIIFKRIWVKLKCSLLQHYCWSGWCCSIPQLNPVKVTQYCNVTLTNSYALHGVGGLHCDGFFLPSQATLEDLSFIPIAGEVDAIRCYVRSLSRL